MNESSSTATAKQLAAQSRRKVLWVAAVFFAPLFVSFVLYYGGVWRPAGNTNKGELITPARPLPQITLRLIDGTQSEPTLLTGKWSWVFIGPAECAQRCRMALADIRQAQLLLVEKANRVQRVWLVSGACCDVPEELRNDPGLIVAQYDEATLGKDFTVDEQAPDTSGRIYLVDPLGNLMMSYTAAMPNMGLLEDIKKLLKLSHIG